jgi:tetratricopeptide (TPR) repeat protein
MEQAMTTRQLQFRMALLCAVVVGLMILLVMLSPVMPYRPTTTPQPTQTIRYAKYSADATADALYAQAFDFYNEANFEAAIKADTEAIQIDPDFADAYYVRALANSKLKDYDAALDDFARAIDLDPQDDEVFIARGTTYLEMGSFQSPSGTSRGLSNFNPIMQTLTGDVATHIMNWVNMRRL